MAVWTATSQLRHSRARSSTQKKYPVFSWQMSQAGCVPSPSPAPAPVEEEERSSTRWCLPASLFAECTAASHRRHSAASSAQHSTAAAARPHASQPIFIRPSLAQLPKDKKNGRIYGELAI